MQPRYRYVYIMLVLLEGLIKVTKVITSDIAFYRRNICPKVLLGNSDVRTNDSILCTCPRIIFEHGCLDSIKRLGALSCEQVTVVQLTH